MQLVLASSSPSRAEALQRLYAPDIDETTRPGESPLALVRRLSTEKALAVAPKFDQHLIQIFALDQKIMGKRHPHAEAVAELTACSGKKACFYTGLTALNSNKQPHIAVVKTQRGGIVLMTAHPVRLS
jgi:septum formation protein